MIKMIRLELTKLIMGIICLAIYFPGIAQGAEPAAEKPLSPPVNIEFNMENTAMAGEEVILKLKVTPIEDMHAEINCLLPEGIEIMREKGIMARPYRERWRKEQKVPIYRQAVVLYVGPLKGGTTKECIFRAKVTKKGRYALMARVEALAKWGVKEEILVLNIE